MKVVIPLAGKGTRLRPHTYVTPKPLLRVGGRPVMSYILDDLRELGVSEIIFITGYLKEEIERYVRAEYAHFTAHFVEQEVQDGTAGAVKLARPYVDEDLLVVFVDTLFDADLEAIESLPEGDAGIVWAKEVEDYRRFGVIVTDGHGYMTRIVEKPKDPISRLANIGLYYIRDHELLFEGIDATIDRVTSQGGEYYLTDAFQYMIDHGARLKVAEVDGWYDCGKPETLLATNRHLLENGRACKPRGGYAVRVHDPVRVEEGVTLRNATIGPNVTIGAGSTIRDSELRDAIVGADSVVEGSTLHDSILGDHVRVRGVHGSANLGHHSEVSGGDGS
ncbi:MAG TPA: sugar phosphate nucleotidyltransferase [Longimicrobiales bacterium]|nr:sugar phosphate nucleotidyltransferase [Longimicrobiales bacterium]